jgi:hypothetical protein
MALHSFDVGQLREALKAARRRGVRDSRLVAHAPALIEVLYPAQEYPDLTIFQRAIAAESLILAAMDHLGGDDERLSKVLFGVDPTTSHLLLTKRREIAAHQAGVLPGTWHRGYREKQLLADLAATIYRLHYANRDAYIPEEPPEPAPHT